MEPAWRQNIMYLLGGLGISLGITGFSLTANKYYGTGAYDKYDYFLNGWLLMFLGLVCFSIVSVYYFTVIVQDEITQIYLLYFFTGIAMMIGAYASWYSGVRMRFAA